MDKKPESAAQFYQSLLKGFPGYEAQHKIIQVSLPQAVWDILQGIAEKSAKESGTDIGDEIEAQVSMYALHGLWNMIQNKDQYLIELVAEQLEKREE